MIPFLKTYTLTTVATQLETSAPKRFTGQIHFVLGTVTLSAGNDSFQLTSTSKPIWLENVKLTEILASGVPSGRKIKLVGIVR